MALVVGVEVVPLVADAAAATAVAGACRVASLISWNFSINCKRDSGASVSSAGRSCGSSVSGPESRSGTDRGGPQTYKLGTAHTTDHRHRLKASWPVLNT